MPLEQILRRAAGWTGVAVAALGLAALLLRLGWLGHAGPVLATNAALCLLLSGASLWLQQRGATASIGRACAALALLLAAAATLEAVAHVNLRAHGWLPAIGLAAPAPATAAPAGLLLVVSAAALLALGSRWGRPVSGGLANLTIAITAAVLLPVLVDRSAGITGAIHINAFLAAALLTLGVGTLLARPDDVHLRILLARNPAGVLARRLFAAVAILPVLFGVAFLWLIGTAATTPIRAALLLVASTVISGFLVALFAVDRAAQMTRERDEAEQARLLLTARLQGQASHLQEMVDQRTRELREANASLRAAAESNALLALVAQHTTNGVVIADGLGRIEWVNEAFTRTTGYSLDDVRGRKPGHVLQGSDTDPATVQLLREAERNGRPCHVEILNYTKSRQPFWEEIDFQPVRDRSGQLVNFVANLTDITQQRANQIGLERLNQRLQLALRSSRFGVWEFDVVNRRGNWDERTLEIYGFRPGEFDGSVEAWTARFHPEDRDELGRQLERLLGGTGTDCHLQYRINHPDGGIRHLESHGHIERDPDNRPLRLVGLTRDVTESKNLELALELAEQRWQLAIEGSNDSVWDWDVTTGHVYHDERWTRILGYEPGELDYSIEGWKALAHPDDLPANEAAIQEHFAQRTPYYWHELRMRAKDGGWRWILDRGKVVRRAADGRPLRMVGTHANVTERRELEDRLRNSEQLADEVSRIAQIGGWEIQLESSRVTWNEGTRRIHEVDAGFTPTLEAFWRFFPPEALATVQAALQDTTPGRPGFDVEVPLITARGRRIWVRMLGHREFAHGRPASVRGAIQDITARHDSEQARRDLEAQLFQAQKMETLGTLAGGIAHDFNNLLTGIIGYHELAADTMEPDHPARACLAEARNASLRARELVEQILTFGRQSSATEHVPVDLVGVLHEAQRFLRATLPANIDITVSCAPGCGQVLGDATQIHQVVLNLGSNAAHAMRSQGGTIAITLEPSEISPDLALTLGGPPATNYVRLSVTDTGHGMDEAIRRRIFDPFFTTKNTREGTGLGLAVVHGIVRSHRGVIDVESVPGSGSTFHVYLPTQPVEPAPSPEAPGDAPRGGGEFVCVVDDEEVVGSCTKLVLEARGYRSLIFSSAEKCLAQLQANPAICSVLVTDQTMPGMQGTELATAIRQLKPDLPVVIMSGYFSKISPQVLDELGQVELLAKPFTTDELAHAVHRALNPAPPALS